MRTKLAASTSESGVRRIAEAVRIHTEVAGARPLGFYQGRSSQTVTLLS
ncbi:MAG: hypothetical protein WB647_09555 [Roseiarcus sp.]